MASLPAKQVNYAPSEIFFIFVVAVLNPLNWSPSLVLLDRLIYTGKADDVAVTLHVASSLL